MQINRNAIPDSGSVTILSHTYTWLRHKDSPSRFTLTKDNFGDWDTDLDTQVELPEVFNFVDLNEENLYPVCENCRGGYVIEYDTDYIDQFEALFDWFKENFPANVTEPA